MPFPALPAIALGLFLGAVAAKANRSESSAPVDSDDPSGNGAPVAPGAEPPPSVRSEQKAAKRPGKPRAAKPKPGKAPQAPEFEPEPDEPEPDEPVSSEGTTDDEQADRHQFRDSGSTDRVGGDSVDEPGGRVGRLDGPAGGVEPEPEPEPVPEPDEDNDQ